ncbi:MAG: helix-turn-helix transcriptional regulator [Dehalococcoidia bacterium]
MPLPAIFLSSPASGSRSGHSDPPSDLYLPSSSVGDGTTPFPIPGRPDTGQAVGDTPRLTPRQMEVLRLMAEGLTNAQIAPRLGLSPNTARIHVENVRQRLGARTRAGAVARARERGLIGEK